MATLRFYFPFKVQRNGKLSSIQLSFARPTETRPVWMVFPCRLKMFFVFFGRVESDKRTHTTARPKKSSFVAFLQHRFVVKSFHQAFVEWWCQISRPAARQVALWTHRAKLLKASVQLLKFHELFSVVVVSRKGREESWDSKQRWNVKRLCGTNWKPCN